MQHNPSSQSIFYKSFLKTALIVVYRIVLYQYIYYGIFIYQLIWARLQNKNQPLPLLKELHILFSLSTVWFLWKVSEMCKKNKNIICEFKPHQSLVSVMIEFKFHCFVLVVSRNVFQSDCLCNKIVPLKIKSWSFEEIIQTVLTISSF